MSKNVFGSQSNEQNWFVPISPQSNSAHPFIGMESLVPDTLCLGICDSDPIHIIVSIKDFLWNKSERVYCYSFISTELS